MPKPSSVRLNVPRQLYDNAKDVLNQFELTPSGVVKLLFKYIAKEQALPAVLFKKSTSNRQSSNHHE